MNKIIFSKLASDGLYSYTNIGRESYHLFNLKTYKRNQQRRKNKKQ